MLNTRPLQHTLWRPVLTLHQAIGDLAQAIVQIFSPSDDHYPKTGVQPFTGDPVDHGHRPHSW